MARHSPRTTYRSRSGAAASLLSSRNRGFTIVELLIVVVVIAILAAITVVAYNGITNRAKASAAASAAGQAAKKIMTYAVINADSYPASLSDVGISDGSTSYQYRVENSASAKAFCVTATTQNVSYWASNVTSTPTPGVCAGHAASGQTLVTNLILNPVGPMTSGIAYKVTPQWYGTGGAGNNSQVSSALDGPATGVTSYMRKTWTTAPTGTSAGAISFAHTGARIPVTAGQSFAASAWMRASWNAGTPIWNTIRIEFYDAATGGTMLSSVNGTNESFSQGNWSYQRAVATVPAGASYMVPLSMFQTQYDPGGVYLPPVGATLDATGFMLTQGATHSAYADGNTPGWVWNGTPNNSTSTGPAQ